MAEKHVSAKKLARLSGVGDTTIGRVLSRQMIPSLDVIDKIFAGLGYETTVAITPNAEFADQAHRKEDADG